MKNCVLTIGKFEGIHLGHKALLAEVVHQAKKLSLRPAAVVFEPHPYIYLNDTQYKPMFTNKERDYLLTNAGIEHIFYCPFDRNLAQMSPQDFCKKIFAEYNAKLVIVGENYRFGKARAGDVELLRSQALIYSAQVQTIAAVASAPLTRENVSESGSIFARLNGFWEESVSTSNIRSLISENNIADANKLLGFPFFVSGIAAKGRQLGRTIGFPTLNIYPPDQKFLPPDGVYATNATVNGTTYRGITNIGLRPTVDNNSVARSVETHLPEYEVTDLYSAHVKVELLNFIRPERKFSSLEELKTQIAKDIEKTLDSQIV